MKKILLLFLLLGVFAEANAQAVSDDSSKKKLPETKRGVFDLTKMETIHNRSIDQKQQILKTMFSAKEGQEFKTVSVKSDELGFSHERMSQYYKGIPIEYSRVTIHSKDGKINTVSSEYYPVKEINVVPQISNTVALNAALQYVNASKYAWQLNGSLQSPPEGELVIYPLLDSKAELIKMTLAYKFSIYAVEPLSNQVVFIDANNGEFLNSDTKLHSASGTAETYHYGNQQIETSVDPVSGSFRLFDETRGIHTRDLNGVDQSATATEFLDSDNNWTTAEHNNASNDNAALDVHWGLIKTFDYFLDNLNWHSYDNAGAQVNALYNPSNVLNAFWNGQEVIFGRGDYDPQTNPEGIKPLVGIDIVAHEFAHAVTESTSGLVYRHEQGALNEAFSDIFGAAVEHDAIGNGNDANPNSDTWRVGEKLNDTNCGCNNPGFRNMNDPHLHDDPKTYKGEHWIFADCPVPENTNDFCGVHTNSGVLNQWFYLCSVGGTGSEGPGAGQAVQGIGIQNAARIAFRALTVYLTPNSQYLDARTALSQAARDLFGAGSSQETSVSNAFYAVGVGNQPAQTDFTPPPMPIIARVNVDVLPYNATSEVSEAYHKITIIESQQADIAGYQAIFEGDYIDETHTNYISHFGTDGFQTWVTPQIVNDVTEDIDSFYLTTKIVAIDKAGNVSDTAINEQFYAYTLDPKTNGGPSTPSLLQPASATSSFVNDIEFTWEASTDNVGAGVTGYDVFINDVFIQTVPHTQLSFDRTGIQVEDNSLYKLSVRARDGDGNVSHFNNWLGYSTINGYLLLPPENLSIHNVTSNSLFLRWDAAADATNYVVYQNQVEIARSTSTFLNVTSLSPSTQYFYTVRAEDGLGNISNHSIAVVASTLEDSNTDDTGDTDDYCSATANFNNFMEIGRVQLRDIDQSSTSDEGYADYTSVSTPIATGDVLSISITYTGGPWGMGKKAWIDFNQDGDFDDQGELVGTSSINQNISTNFTLNVPAGAAQGATRMRVMAYYNNNTFGPCDFRNYGEVEDYTVVIGGNTNTQPPAAPTNLSANSITETSLTLTWNASNDATNYIIYQNGAELNRTSSTSLNVTSLAANTQYSFTVRATDAANNVSDESTALVVRTLANTQPPAAPTNLSAKSITENSLTLTWNASNGATNYIVYQNGAEFGGTSSLIFNVTSLSTSTVYSFTVRAADAANNVSDESTALVVTTLASSATGGTSNYCSATALNDRFMEIGRVQLRNIDQSSTSDEGYADYTSSSTSIATGDALIISITYTGGSWNMGKKAWIDFNQDGDFDDQGELIGSSSLNQNILTEFTVTVPAGATQGATRMRVMAYYNNNTFGPCDNRNYGEVEDYTVVIGGSTNTQPPAAPTNLSANSVTETSLTLTWNASNGASNYIVYQNGAELNRTSSTSYNVTSLSASTQYSFTVRAVDASNIVSDESAALVVTTLASSGPNYCSAEATANCCVEIGRVQLRDIDQSSTSDEGYADHTSSSTSIATGDVLTITVAYDGNQLEMGKKAWIDFNQDGDFDDQGELVGISTIDKVTSTNFTLTVPEGATQGATRMRVMAFFNNITFGPCDNMDLGEVEDYTVVIDANSNTQPPAAPTNLSANSVTETSLTLTWNTSNGATNYIIYQNGAELNRTSSTSYNVTSLSASTQYAFTVRAVDAANNVSDESTTLVVSTLASSGTGGTSNYCSVEATNNGYMEIGRVQLRDIDQSSTSDEGYADHTSSSTSITTGDVLTISITYTGGQWSMGKKAWIDFNQDGDFDDQGELVGSIFNQDVSTEFTLTVPAGAVQGTTRMRVMAYYNNSNFGPCNNPNYGEVEDYTVVIGGSTNTQPPAAPTNLSSHSVTQTSVILTWRASNSASNYIVYQNGAEIGRTSSTFFNVTSLSANTQYTFTVKAVDAADQVSDESNQHVVRTLESSGNYCSAAATGDCCVGIGRVQLRDIDQSSSLRDTYSDFTSSSTSIATGDVLTITIAYSGSSIFMGKKAWIDFNQDGDFDDQGELVGTSAVDQVISTNFTVNVPAGAVQGATRMRVMAFFNNITFGPCDNPNLGEVEDYTVVIGGSTNTQPPAAPTNLSANSVTENSLILTWNASNGATNYIVSQNGTELGGTSSTSLNVTSLSANTEYSFTVRAVDASNNSSDESTALVVTTLASSGNGGTGGASNYCAAEATNNGYMEIGRVQLRDIDQSSTSDAGYADHTSSSTSIATGDVLTISITYLGGSTWNMGKKAWIDFNQDGDFDDQGELVGSSSLNRDASTEFTLTVPAGAVQGATRMRVIAYFNISNFGPCDSPVYGEVEDYTVVIATTTGSGSIASNTNYCTAEATKDGYMEIGRVQLRGIDQSSTSNEGYADYTSRSTTIATGDVLTISITYTGGPWNMGKKAWIDFNQDGDFDDQGELVGSIYNQDVSTEFTLNVPAGAAQGATRMRIIAFYNNNNFGPCYNPNYGEVEDYTVIVSSNSRQSKSDPKENLNVFEVKDDVNLYPNPVTGGMIYSNINADKYKLAMVYDSFGRLLLSVNQELNKIDVSHIPAGLYVIKFYTEAEKEGIHKSFIKYD